MSARLLTLAPHEVIPYQSQTVIVHSRRKDKSDPKDPRGTPDIAETVVRMKLDGWRAPQSFEGLEEAKSISNRFTGGDPFGWIPGIPSYGRVGARRVHKVVDLVYCGNARKLRYDLVLRSCAGPRRIHLAYPGADSLITYYLGGSDPAYSIAVDSTGVVYVTDNTNSINFPTMTGTYQGAESKIESPVADGKIAAWTIPPSAQLNARNSGENLCNGF